MVCSGSCNLQAELRSGHPPGDVRELRTTLGRRCWAANASGNSIDLEDTAAPAPALRRCARFSGLPAVPTTAAPAVNAIWIAARPRPPACHPVQFLQLLCHASNGQRFILSMSQHAVHVMSPLQGSRPCSTCGSMDEDPVVCADLGNVDKAVVRRQENGGNGGGLRKGNVMRHGHDGARIADDRGRQAARALAEHRVSHPAQGALS